MESKKQLHSTRTHNSLINLFYWINYLTYFQNFCLVLFFILTVYYLFYRVLLNGMDKTPVDKKK